MDNTYLRDKPKKSGYFIGLLFIIVVIVCIGGIGYLNIQKKYVSPIPEKPSFVVIYYTPVPSQVDNLSTPSATPKVKKSIPSPTSVSSVTVKPKIPSPTVKITQTE
jgi:cytoskeletal protein RodZ